MDTSTDDQTLPCEGKLVFESPDAAASAAAAVDWQRGAKLRGYRCKYCRLWHLTSSPNE